MDLVVALAVALGATEGEEDKKAIISVIGDASADAFDFKAESASSSMWGPAFPPCLSLSLSLILSLSPPTAPRPFQAFAAGRQGREAAVERRGEAGGRRGDFENLLLV